MSHHCAAILLSRKSLRPFGSLTWVRQAVAAVRWIRSQDMILHTSIGLSTWELLLAAASLLRVKLVVFISAPRRDDFLRLQEQTIKQFDLEHDRAEFRPVFTPPVQTQPGKSYSPFATAWSSAAPMS